MRSCAGMTDAGIPRSMCADVTMATVSGPRRNPRMVHSLEFGPGFIFFVKTVLELRAARMGLTILSVLRLGLNYNSE